MKHHWHITDSDTAAAGDLARALGVSKLLAQCLMNRGLGDETEAVNFLAPRLANLAAPEDISNLSIAVERLFVARERGERIAVFGDYDVDGVTSATLLLDCLRPLGWQVEAYLPHRMDEGYGLTAVGVANCLEKHQPDLLLAVDCGSTSVDVIADLHTKGIEVIVLDHHQVSDPPPPALAIVNPQLAAEGEPDFRELCSAGLAFKLIHGLVKAGREKGLNEFAEFDIRTTLDLVALGTLADMVPLRRENRILAHAGLRQLNCTERPGILALAKAAGITGEIGGFEVGFQIGPRLNAAGRLGSATAALDLLRETDAAAAAVMAGKLDRQNRDRQLAEKEITRQVIDTVRNRFNPETDFAIVEGDPGWHIGVVGIVASRVMREFCRPTVIVGGSPDGDLRGSGRSLEGFDLAAALHECESAGILDRAGGHAMAAGVSLQPKNLDGFRTHLNELAREQLSGKEMMPTLRLDASVPLTELTFAAVQSLDQLQPTGQGNHSVQFSIPQLELDGPVRRMGKEQQHAKLSVTDGNTSAEAICWNATERDLPTESTGRFDLAVEPSINTWRGQRSLQLKILDWRPAVS
ncbi:MAG TPA: single-stranded-DNA-specific exonuclease RecJ [Verrucomicrobiales bacterium]|nr:single-stranded-DNA-specific exonuclease RecJ [Verrucomicrobiales bacterium]